MPAFRHLLGSWLRRSWLLKIGRSLEVRRNCAYPWRVIRHRVEDDSTAGNAFGLLISLTNMLFPRPIPCGQEEWHLRPLRVFCWNAYRKRGTFRAGGWSSISLATCGRLSVRIRALVSPWLPSMNCVTFTLVNSDHSPCAQFNGSASGARSKSNALWHRTLLTRWPIVAARGCWIARSFPFGTGGGWFG